MEETENQDQDTKALPARIAEQWDGWSPERKRLYERRKVNHSVRYRILKRDDFRCQICGKTKDDKDDQGEPVRLHVDHKVSMANGGKSVDENLWTLCYDCNRGKGDWDVDDEPDFGDDDQVEPVEIQKPAVKQRATRVSEEPQPDGTMAYRYSDGSLRNERGWMIDPIPGKYTITQADASRLARQKWERSREAFATGIAEGMRKSAPIDAWSAIGEKAAHLLREAKSARGFSDLARFAGEAGGFVPMARGREEMQEQSNGDQPAIVVLIMQYISAMRNDGDVIEGQIKD